MSNVNKKIFCVIPAFNEEIEIANAIKGARKIIGDIVVVDDASIDNTAEIAERAGAKVLRHLVNRGQGAALETGNEFALNNNADIIIHFDADGQFLAEEIPALIAPLLTGEQDAVLGSRFIGKKPAMPFMKKYLIYPVAKFISRHILGLNITDPQCGFRALSRQAAETIKIDNDRMAHCSEILMKIKDHKIKYCEIPVTVIYKRYGQNFTGGFNILKDLLLAKFIH